LSLQDDGFGDELGTNKGGQDATGDNHKKKAKHQLRAQGKPVQEGDIRENPQEIRVILSSIPRGKLDFIIDNNRPISQSNRDAGNGDTAARLPCATAARRKAFDFSGKSDNKF
jgi:hypothetical protein